MADFYRITTFTTNSDLFYKLGAAVSDAGFDCATGTNVLDITINPSNFSKVKISLDSNDDFRFTLTDIEGNRTTAFDGAFSSEIMRCGGNIAEVHIFGWENPKAVLAAFRRSDEVWVMWYVGALDNIGGNPQSYIFSHSNQYYDGEYINGNSVTSFPHMWEYGYRTQRPLFSNFWSQYKDDWGTAVNWDAGENGGNDWHWPTTGNGGGVLVPLVISNFHYEWGSNLGWKKLQAVNPAYDFPSQLLPIDVYYVSNPTFYPLGNVAHIRATKRDGINALDRVTVGNEEFLMLPWSRVGVRTNGIGSKNYLFAVNLTDDQIVPVSI